MATKQVLRKAYEATVKSIDPEKGIVEVVVSTAARDRDNEVILPDAWRKRLKDYKNHPIVLTSHAYRDFPEAAIGKAEKVAVTDEGLQARIRYLLEDNPRAKLAFRLVQEGLGAFSVGFSSYDSVDGDGVKEPLRTYTDVELLEISQVAIPSNREALARMAAKALDDGEKDGELEKMVTALKQDELPADSSPATEPATTITDEIARQERLQEAYEKASAPYWAAMDLLWQLMDEGISDEDVPARVDAIFVEYVALAKPAWLDYIRLSRQYRKSADAAAKVTITFKVVPVFGGKVNASLSDEDADRIAERAADIFGDRAVAFATEEDAKMFARQFVKTETTPNGQELKDTPPLAPTIPPESLQSIANRLVRQELRALMGKVD